MSNISNIKDCYGCGLCATVCPKVLISLQVNNNGFYEPVYNDSETCIECGLCSAVCSYQSEGLSVNNPVISSYASWSKDEQVRRKCSSGGVAFEVSRKLIRQGYKVCCVRYNAELNRAEHYIAETIEELIPGVGSKYIQSYTEDAFRSIDRKQKYLVIGTPCQMDSFRRYIRKFKCEDNFVLMDFFCHGVPSVLMWNKYAKDAEKKVGKITYVSWRNKFEYGRLDSWLMEINSEKTSKPIDWHDSYNLLISGKKTYTQSRKSQGDIFYKMFLSNSCLGLACYDKCKYKACNSSADIRVGDLWGSKYSNTKEGVSAVLALTQKGKSITEESYLHLEELPVDIVAEAQMEHRTKKHVAYDYVMSALRKDNTKLNVIYKIYIYPIRLLHLPIGAFNRIKRLLKK